MDSSHVRAIGDVSSDASSGVFSQSGRRSSVNRFPQVVLLRYAVLLIGCVSASAIMNAQQTFIFNFLRSTISARMAGLGGATVAVAQDPANMVINPAVLTTVDSSVVTATFIKHVLDINAGYATYNRNVEGLGNMGFTVGYLNYGSFSRTSVTGDRTGSFGANDIAVSASLANELDSTLSYGVTAKILHSTIPDMSSTALAVDAGLLYQIPAKRVNIGLSILNIGTQLSTYDGVRDRLPLDMRLGVSHRLRGLPLLVNFSLNHLTDETDDILDRLSNFSVGGELYLGKVLQARLSYDNRLRNTSSVNIASQLSGLSAGVGLRLPSFSFDYAYSALGAAAVMHRLSLVVPLQ
ncbi:MAG: type IX secretion system protein PorQ [Candidatus Kapabacteria bacterium]|nr:type IX secretion system protein PorQ [Candidatus Kapabacteria bacterium]